MSLPSHRDIQTRLFTLVGAAVLSLAASGVYAELKQNHRPFSSVADALLRAAGAEPQFEAFASEPIPDFALSSIEDVNLETGRALSPEDEVSMARSGMLSDFEAQ